MINGKILVHLRAPVMTQSGYGAHSREVIDYLLQDEKFIVALEGTNWGSCGYLHEKDFRDSETFHKYRECMFLFEQVKDREKFDISIQVTIPNEFRRRAQINIGVTAGIEVDRVAREWVHKCNEMDLIVVPSLHSAQVLAGTVYSIKNEQTGEVIDERVVKSIFVIPEFYDKPEDIGGLDISFSTKKNLLHVGQWGPGEFGEDRKNIGDLVKMFVHVFKGDKNAGLVLKVQCVNGSSYDKDEVKKRIKQIKDNFPGALCKIHLIHQDLTEKEMWALYHHPQIQGFISLTHGEGFCVLKDTPVITKDGFKKISEVTLDDKVLTHNNNFKSVDTLLQREYRGEMYKITPYNYSSSEELTLTPNHRVWCYENGEKFWKKTDELKEGDQVVLSFNFNNEKESINLFDYIDDKNISLIDEKLTYNHSDKKYMSLNNKIKLDEKFGRLIGYYLSEGSSGNSTVKFSLGAHEIDTLGKDISNIVKDVFGLECFLKINENKLDVSFNSKFIQVFLKNICGSTSKDKFIHSEFLNSNKKFKKGLICGLLSGDGHFNYGRRSNNSIEIDLVNFSLIQSLRLLLAEFRIVSNYSKNFREGEVFGYKYSDFYHKLRVANVSSFNILCDIINENLPYIKVTKCEIKSLEKGIPKSFFDKDGSFITQIKKIEKINYLGTVYNISVEDDESYSLDGFTVHNCRPALEAAAAGMPVIATNWSGHTDFLRKGFGYIPLDFEMGEIPEAAVWDGVLIRGSNWAKVVDKDVHKKMKKFLDGPKKIQREAESNLEWLKENFSKEAAYKKWDDFFGAFIKTQENLPDRNGYLPPPPDPAKMAAVDRLKELLEESDKKKVIYIIPQSAGDCLMSTAIIDTLIKARHWDSDFDFYIATNPPFRPIFDQLKEDFGVKLLDYDHNLMFNSELLSEVFDYVYSPGINVQYTFSNWLLGNGEYSVRLLEEFAKNCNLHPNEITNYNVAIKECATPDGDYVVLHPGGQKSAKTYRYWPDVIENLKEMLPGIQVVQIGTNDEPLLPGVLDYRGREFAESFHIIKQAKALVGVDSFPAHAAAAMETPHLVIYASTHATTCAPLMIKKRVPQIAIEGDKCNPKCYKDVCRRAVNGEKNCLSHVSVRSVCSSLYRLIEMTEEIEEREEL